MSLKVQGSINLFVHAVRYIICKKTLMWCCYNILFYLLFVTTRAIGSDELSQSVEMNFSVNIEPPVCKLQSTDVSVNFGDFQLFDIVTRAVKKQAKFSFTDCLNVNTVTVSFSGDNVDTEHNIIKNKSGTNYASGIAIGLYDNDGNRIQLNDKKDISIDDANSFDFIVTAEVMKESSSAIVTPGNIVTSVDLMIEYN
ncbi:fimbrial protein [Escherichia coli]|nr:fimbrial protein [Escherichia coli]